MTTNDRRNVGILLFPDVEVLDFAGPFEVFSRTRLESGSDSRRSDDSAPFNVFTVARTLDPISATGDLQVLPHHSFDDVPPIDLLVIPGGFGTRPLMDDQETLDWIRSRSGDAELTTSVCTGSLLLGRAGLLRGRRATTHWAAIDLLRAIPEVEAIEGARFVDDTVISSAGVSAGIDMAFYVVSKLFGTEVATETARYIDYPWQPEDPS